MGETEVSGTYLEATYVKPVTSNEYENVMEFEWTLNDGKKEYGKYYTYAVEAERANTFTSQLRLPTIESGTNLSAKVAAKGWYSGGAYDKAGAIKAGLPGGMVANERYTASQFENWKNNADYYDEKEMKAVSGWDLEKSKNFSLTNYAGLFGLTIPASGIHHDTDLADDTYNKATNTLAVNEIADVGKTYATASYASGASTETGMKVNGADVAAFRWTWTDPNGTKSEYYTYANIDSSGDTDSKFAIPRIAAAGTAKLSVAVKLWDKNANSIVLDYADLDEDGKVREDVTYSADEFKGLADEINKNKAVSWVEANGVLARSDWSDDVAFTDGLVVTDETVLTGLDLVSSYATSGINTSFMVGESKTWKEGTWGPVNLLPGNDKVEGAVFTVSTSASDEKYVKVTSFDPATGIATIKAVAAGDAKIVYTVTQQGLSAPLSKEISIHVGENKFDVSQTGTNGVTIYTHEGAGEVDLDTIFVNPSIAQEKLNSLSITRKASGLTPIGDGKVTDYTTDYDYTASEIKTFKYSYDYPTASADNAKAKEQYKLNGSKLTIMDADAASAKLEVTIGCGDDGETTATYNIVVEKVLPTTLAFDPDSITIARNDIGNERKISTYVGGAAVGNINWSVPNAHKNYVKINGEAVSENYCNVDVQLLAGAADFYTADVDLNISVSATQTLQDGTGTITATGTLPVHIKKDTVTL
ncbi:MAG: hypothetical protein IJ679_01860, partial [Lachnospiraceae bacterium]|nr:hypothetical protein [Lachnospiraceae bacterium]